MAGRSVSEDDRTLRNEMGHACVEIQRNLLELERRLEVAKAAELAQQAGRLAKLYGQLNNDAASERPISPFCLRTTGRVFCDVAIKLHQAIELLPAVESHTTIARYHMGEKLARLGELTGQVFLLVDLPLEAP